MTDFLHPSGTDRQLILKQHTEQPSRQVVEAWFRGQLVATITMDGAAPIPVVRVVSKHLKQPEQIFYRPPVRELGPSDPGSVDILLDSK